MRTLLLVASIALTSASQALYIWQIWRGETKPPFTTRLALTLALFLNLLSIHQAHGNVGAQAFAAVSFLQALITTMQSLKYTITRPSLFDLGCLAISITGSILFYRTHNPTTGMVMSIVADLVAYLPYFRNAWFNPEPKVWKSFALSGVGAGTGLAYAFLSSRLSLTFGYQMYIVVADGIFILFNARPAPNLGAPNGARSVA